MKKFLFLLVGIFIIITINYSSVFANSTYEYKFVTTWGSRGTANGQFGSDWGPMGLIYVPETQLLYVGDYGNNRVQAFTTNGDWQNTWNVGFYVGELVYDGSGHFYAISHGCCLVKFDSDFNQIWSRSFPIYGWCDNGIYIDSDGNIHASSCGWAGGPQYSQVYKFAPNGTSLGGWGGDELKAPSSLFATEGFVYVVDVGIKKFTNGGVYVEEMSLPPGVNAQGHQALFIDASGNFFVGCSDDKIRKYSPDWELLTEWGSSGSEEGEFTEICGIALDEKGYVYVADCTPGSGEGNRRIQVFAPQPPSLEERVEQLEQQVNNLTQENEILKQQIQNNTQRIDALEILVNTLQETVNSIQQTLNNIISDIATYVSNYLSNLPKGLRQQMICGAMEQTNITNSTGFGLYCEIDDKGCKCQNL